VPTKCILIIQLELHTFGPHKGERHLLNKFDKNIDELSDSSKFFDVNIS